MSTDGQGTKRRRKIAEYFNRLSRVPERYSLGERCKLPQQGPGEPGKKLVLLHFGASKIINFIDFAFVYGVGHDSYWPGWVQIAAGGQVRAGWAEPPSHSSL